MAFVLEYNLNFINTRICKRLLQLGWCTVCESKQKAFLERLSARFPDTFQLSMPDPPHNIKSVRSAIFWYWVFIDKRLVNLRMLVVVRRDSSPAVSSPMKSAVTLKALKNKDRMSVETAIEVLTPEVQRTIPTDDIVTTIVPEIYTIWRQNRPGILKCPVDAAVHQPTETIFFSDQFAHQIMMSDLYCPAMLSSIAGENTSGLRDGRKSLFQNPSGLCIYANLIFVCDSSNASIRIIYIFRLVSRKKNDSLFYDHEARESEDQDNTVFPSLESIPSLADFL